MGPLCAELRVATNGLHRVRRTERLRVRRSLDATFNAIVRRSSYFRGRSASGRRCFARICEFCGIRCTDVRPLLGNVIAFAILSKERIARRKLLGLRRAERGRSRRSRTSRRSLLRDHRGGVIRERVHATHGFSTSYFPRRERNLILPTRGRLTSDI